MWCPPVHGHTARAAWRREAYCRSVLGAMDPCSPNAFADRPLQGGNSGSEASRHNATHYNTLWDSPPLGVAAILAKQTGVILRNPTYLLPIFRRFGDVCQQGAVANLVHANGGGVPRREAGERAEADDEAEEIVLQQRLMSVSAGRSTLAEMVSTREAQAEDFCQWVDVCLPGVLAMSTAGRRSVQMRALSAHLRASSWSNDWRADHKRTPN